MRHRMIVPLVQSRTLLILLLAGFAAAHPQQARAQEKMVPPESESVAFLLADSTHSDTAARVLPRPRLLPENISFVENGLWGENGLMRRMGIASPLTPEARKHELQVRRTMLTMHQIGGFVTLGLMAGAVYYGQKSIDGGGRNVRGNHQTFVTATIISYGLTGALAALSPPPYIRRNETSTITVHKTLAWIHFGGMVITPILGSMIGRHRASQTAHVHQIAGYITLATLTASMIDITF